MKCLSIVDFSSGQIIYKEGDLSDALYFLLDPAADAEWQLDAEEGGILTTDTNGDGDEPQQVLPLVPGKGFFGEEGLVYRRVRDEHVPAGLQANTGASAKGT